MSTNKKAEQDKERAVMKDEVEEGAWVRMLSIGISRDLTFKPKSDWSEGMRHADIRKESISGRVGSRYPGPEAVPNLGIWVWARQPRSLDLNELEGRL